MTNLYVQLDFWKMVLGYVYFLFNLEKKSFGEQYKKYDWVEIDLVKNTSDFRKESYRPVSYDTEIKILENILL